MVRLIIARHGYSAANKLRIFCGQTDVPLEDIGILQAEELAEYVSDNYSIDAVYSSDLTRAYETVRPLAEKLGLPIKTDERLREIDVGNWKGIPYDEVKNHFPEQFAAYKEDPCGITFDGGENYSDVMKRAKEAIEDIAAENEGKTVIVATHGGLIRSLRVVCENICRKEMKDLPTVPNASLSLAVYDNGKLAFESIGYDDYLKNKSPQLKK